MTSPDMDTGPFERWGGPVPTYGMWALTRQTFVITLVALLLAEISVFVVYRMLGDSRTLYHAVIAFVVTMTVAIPIAFHFTRQKFQLASAHAQIARAAMYDHLSGLLNRGSFVARVDAALCGMEDDAVVAMLYVDADRFKELNDVHGHAMGDAAIELIGRVICENVASHDAAGRLGGEEFAVFLRNAGTVEANAVAGRIARAVREESAELALVTPLTVSIGISAEYARQGCDALLHSADSALYEAKEQGRDRVVEWRAAKARRRAAAAA